MAYDPAELTTRDALRGLVQDTGTEPILADVTYDALIARYGVANDPVVAVGTVAYLRAGAEIARRVAIAIEADPTSINSTGDGSVTWSSRTASLQKLAVELDAKADRIEAGTTPPVFGTPITVRGTFLTGPEA